MLPFYLDIANDVIVLRHYHLDKVHPDEWVDEEDLPSWVHDDDVNTDQDGRRDRRSYPADDETSTLSEQVDLLGLVKGNILKSKNVRGDGTHPMHHPVLLLAPLAGYQLWTHQHLTAYFASSLSLSSNIMASPLDFFNTKEFQSNTLSVCSSCRHILRRPLCGR